MSVTENKVFVNVILPVPLAQAYTYAVPEEFVLQVEVGKRVIVQFGKQKLYSAIILSVHGIAPVHHQAKAIQDVIDSFPIVSSSQLDLWQWMASYYMCSTGEVMSAALPTGLRLQSETVVVPKDDFEDLSTLDARQELLLDVLKEQRSMTINDIVRLLGGKGIMGTIKKLMDCGAIQLEQELKDAYKPLLKTFVKLSADAQNEDWLREQIEKLEKKAPQQVNLILAFFQLQSELNFQGQLQRVRLLKYAKANTQALNALVKKGIFEIEELSVSRLQEMAGEGKNMLELSPEQEEAFIAIKEALKSKDFILLHGITASGKTEVYIQLIKETLAEGRSALFLLPEIALTAQMIGRLKKHFKEQVLVYHSRLNDMERAEVWKTLVTATKPYLILGARSAVLLPFPSIGLVIIDEEHDGSYKQQNPSPRYHARDVALYLCQEQGAKAVLGSATPSIESYYKAKSGKFTLIELNKRYHNTQDPVFTVVDMKEQFRKKLNKSHFSENLFESISSTVEKGEQVILFQNRRGYAPALQCQKCAWVPHCPNCDVALTYHKGSNELRCHCCAYHRYSPKSCEACGHTDLKMLGFGTEKVEDELRLLLPHLRVDRMDMDTTRGKNALPQLIERFQDHEIDVLVGTQMVTKGLDFENVTLVGILNADAALHYPDFRAFERSYQLMAQVAGRAGRKNKGGHIIIQSNEPQHFVIKNIINGDFITLYNSEIAERESFNFPPFCRMIEILFRHKDLSLLYRAINIYAELLKKELGERVQGPYLPVIPRINNIYYYHLMVKIERSASLRFVKSTLNKAVFELYSDTAYKPVQISFDVDPM